jgi:mono/diheme cytochrome c family protein
MKPSFSAAVVRMFERLTRTQTFFAGALAALVAIGLTAALIGGAIVFFGIYDISASKPHSALTAWALHTTMTNSVAARANYKTAPRQFSAEQAREGFALYEDHCAMCHGGPGIARPKWVMGLEPTPPYLVDAARQWSPAELRFIIKNGVKMTAMPAWGLSRSDEEITSLVAFLENLPAITPEQYRALQAQRPRKE